jgi:ribosomal protein S18 acetylase RimI-like enzyme
MPDMLVRLYDLPDAAPYRQRIAADGYRIRRADPWDRLRLRKFIRTNFQELWEIEADHAFSNTPITCHLAVGDRQIAGFAVYESTRRGYFGPTGVREDLRGNGLGAALLLACLESMREMGYGYAIIGGVGPAEFYEKIVGAFAIPGSDPGVYDTLADFLGGAT